MTNFISTACYVLSVFNFSYLAISNHFSVNSVLCIFAVKKNKSARNLKCFHRICCAWSIINESLSLNRFYRKNWRFIQRDRSVEQCIEMPRINKLFGKEPRMWDQDEPSPIMTRYRGTANECFGFSIQSPMRVFFTSSAYGRIKSPMKSTTLNVTLVCDRKGGIFITLRKPITRLFSTFHHEVKCRL